MQLLQLRSKKWFTSIYFLQILTKPCRTPIIRDDILLNASWFSWARTQKRAIFSKNWFGKKYKKYFIVNNNKKTIRAWYLREALGGHMSPEEDWNFPSKNCYKLGYFCITKIKLGWISSRKKVYVFNFVKMKNPTMTQLNRIH